MNKNDLNNEHLDIDIYEEYSYDYLNDNQAIFSYCIESGYLVFTGHHILATSDGLNHQNHLTIEKYQKK